MSICKWSSLWVALTLAFPALSEGLQGYYRAPDLHQDQLVFTAEGDLFVKSLSSAHPAQRLTTHAAEEINAHWSPDGQWLAYQANYEGVTEVYLIASHGGQPKRVTFENSRVKVQGWTANGQILYSTDHSRGPVNQWNLKMVDPLSLQTQVLPLADAVEGVVDAKGEYVYFIRFGLQLTGDHAQSYQGGAKGQLWKYRLGSDQEAIRLAADHPGSLRQVQLWQEQILLISDAGGHPNIWQFDLTGKAGRAITRENNFQIRAFRVDADQAVYQLGADLYRFDLIKQTAAKIPIQLQSDGPYLRSRYLEKPTRFMTAANVAGKADKAVITTRGHVIVLAKPPLRAVYIKTPANSRSRNAVLSPDGRFVYLINDQSGENEIWRYSVYGQEPATQLTKDGATFRWGLYPSPSGRYLAHDDKHGDLWLLDLDSGQQQKIYSQGSGLTPYETVVWSGDSSQLAFTLAHQQRLRSQVVLYQMDSQQSQILTTADYVSYSPAFSPDGDWLYFLSERNFEANPASPWGDRNMGPAFDRRSQVYALPLKHDRTSPFLPPNELTSFASSHEKTAKQPSKLPTTAKALALADIPRQLYLVPVAPGNYSKLQLNDKFLFLLESGDQGAASKLKTVAIDHLKPQMQVFSDQVVDFALNHSGQQLLLVKKAAADESHLFLVDAQAKATEQLASQQLASQDLILQLDPKAEWQQMFRDAWIMHRDSLFDPNMRGLDWQQSKTKYQGLVQRLTDRYELDDLLSQMMGELNALHSQVRGGEYAKASEAAQQASLGAELSFEKNQARITAIYQTDPELPAFAAPLLKPGVDVEVGDIILSINGQPILDKPSYHHALLQQQGKQVLLQLQRGSKTLATVVQPIAAAAEAQLRYQDWVVRNKQKVAVHSQQAIGYIHLNAMIPADLAVFARDFYAQLDKPALIIDVRRNRGGNIDSILIEKLLRRAWSFWQPVRGRAYPNMQASYAGQLVVLADELTYSDGETFTAGVKSLGLAQVIGQQTAGAGVWLSGRNLLTDFGVARVAETAQFAIDGRWVIEGRGVSPDQAVINYPRATFYGQDAQLEAAINYLQQQLKSQPPVRLEAKPLQPGIAADI